MVEHSARQAKAQGSSPATAAGIGGEKMVEKNMFCLSLKYFPGTNGLAYSGLCLNEEEKKVL